MDLSERIDAPDTLVGRMLPGGLEVVAFLGQSGFGRVYQARYPRPGPPVALTVLQPTAHLRGLSAPLELPPRLLHQLRQACEIRHQNVAGLLEVCQTGDGMTYVIGELVEG